MRVLQARTKRPLNLLAVGAGGRVAASCGLFAVPCEVDVWDAATGAHVHTYRGPDREATALAFEPDGRHLLVGHDETIARVDPAAKTAGDGPRLSLWFPAFSLSADGSRLLVTDVMREMGGVECFAVEPGPSFRKLWSEGPRAFRLYGEPAISPDGSRVAVSEHEGFGDHPSNTLQIREAKTGKVLAEVEFGASDPLEQIVFSADGAKVLARSSGRTVKVFDATGQAAGELLHPGRPFVTGMAVHPDGTVACCRNNGTVCLWNLERREIVRTLDWKLGKLVSVAFSPDGSVGAAGTEDGQVVVWDVD